SGRSVTAHNAALLFLRTTFAQNVVSTKAAQSFRTKSPELLPDVSSPGMLFPGQGAQTPGMGVWLCENHPLAHDLFERAGEILGYDLKQLCADGPAESL